MNTEPTAIAMIPSTIRPTLGSGMRRREAVTYATVAAMKPFYMIRLLGGLFFLSGALIMVFNIWRTVRGEPKKKKGGRPSSAQACRAVARTASGVNGMS